MPTPDQPDKNAQNHGARPGVLTQPDAAALRQRTDIHASSMDLNREVRGVSQDGDDHKTPTTIWECFKAWRVLDAEAKKSWKVPEEIRRSPIAHAALLYLQMLWTRPVFAILGMMALITMVPYQIAQWLSVLP